MKKLNIYYWFCTGSIILPLGIGSVFELGSDPNSVLQFTQLGYPAYLAPFLGFARILALVAIVIPKYPKLKEWAYAGLTFDVICAIFSQIASGQPLTDIIFPLLMVLLISGSYIFYHKKMGQSPVTSTAS